VRREFGLGEFPYRLAKVNLFGSLFEVHGCGHSNSISGRALDRAASVAAECR
jgi:hypothetical protein